MSDAEKAIDKLLVQINADLRKMGDDLDEVGRKLDGTKNRVQDMTAHVVAAAFLTLVGFIVAADIALWLTS